MIGYGLWKKLREAFFFWDDLGIFWRGWFLGALQKMGFKVELSMLMTSHAAPGLQERLFTQLVDGFHEENT